MIRRLVSFIGTASPRPHPATAVLMPTTRHEESASAPPELPGLSAASVWITSSTTRAVRPSRGGRERARPRRPPGPPARADDAQVRQRVRADDVDLGLRPVAEDRPAPNGA